MDEGTYRVGEPEKIKARVKELKASGALVELPDGQTARLPVYEIYPDFKPYEDFHERAKDLVGQEIEVIEIQDPIRSRSGQRLVSYIRAKDDPWKGVSSWSEGDVKVMEVVAKTKERVMGIVSPGIRAEILLKPAWELLKVPSWQRFGSPLVGDEVAGLFHKDGIDEQNHIVTFDYAGFVRSGISVKKLLSLYGQETVGAFTTVDNLHFGDSVGQGDLGNLRVLHGVDSILIVDDDKVFLNSLRTFLESRVRKAVACETYEDAVNAIKADSAEFDLAIIDVHIPRDNRGGQYSDHLGIDLARILRTQHSGCSVVIITGEDLNPSHRKLQEAGDLEISAFFSKPFGVRDLYNALAAADAPPKPILELLPGKEGIESAYPERELASRSDLGDAADSLRADINAEGVVLFSIHPVTYSVSIIASSDPNNLYSALKPKLDRSPVRDAAIDREEIFANDALNQSEFPKHRWLQRAYRYRSCIGVSLRSYHASPLAYALFAFHRQRERFKEGEHLNRVRLAAREMEHILYRRSLDSELRQMKPFELMGKVYGSMAHELTSLFSDEFLLNELEGDLTSENCSTALEKVKILREQSRRASGILHTFRSMARGQHDIVEDFHFEEALPEMVKSFRGKAEASDVALFFESSITGSCRVRMQKSGLELIIYNLLLNAAQQLERLRFLRDCRGEILIELEDDTDYDGARWCIIKIHDNGPGIHKRDFRRVFDVHYTTKDQGCGMGLDICRNIARRVSSGGRNGELSVSRSILLAGTTFELRLPLQ